MPTTKYQKRQERSPDEALVVKIWGTMDARKMTNEALGSRLGMSAATLTRRKRHPEEFTLREIRCITRALDIPIEEMRLAAIRI